MKQQIFDKCFLLQRKKNQKRNYLGKSVAKAFNEKEKENSIANEYRLKN